MRLALALRGLIDGWIAGSAVHPIRKSAASLWADTLFRTAADTLPGLMPRVTKPFLQHPTIYRAMIAFARNVARMPYELFKRGTDVAVAEHPVLKLLAKPNANLRGTQIFELTTLHLEDAGNALWLLGGEARANNAGDRIPTRIDLLQPRSVSLKLAEDGTIESYEQRSAKGQTVRFTPEQVIHFKYLSPYSAAEGFSWTQAARSEYEADFFAQAWNKLFFTRGAEPGVVLQPKDEYAVQDEDTERICEQWRAKQEGIQRAHGVAVAPTGMEVVKTGIGQKEMDFVSLRRNSRENILVAAGLPPALASVLEYANYANMQPQLRIFFELELMPRLRYIESVLQSDLLDRFASGLEGRFKTDSIQALLEDENVKSQVAQRYWQMGVPLSELNDRLELGFDIEDIPGADEAYIPLGVVPAVGNSEPPAAAPAGNPSPALPPMPEPGQASNVVPFRKRLRGEVVRASAWRSMMARLRDLNLKAESRWRDHVYQLRTEVLKKLAAAAERSLRRKKLTEGGIDAILFDLRQAQEEIVLSLDPVYLASLQRGADLVADQTGIAIDLDLLDPAVVQILAGRHQRIKATDVRMRDELRAEIAEGVKAGESELDIADRVREYFAGERRNAATIARTEVHSSFSAGNFEAMHKAGVERHEWLSARDDRVREDHQIEDGTAVPVGDVFPTVGLRFPLEPGGAADEVINCFPPGTQMQGAIVAASRAEYVGPLVEITTRAGKRLAVTPNHPVLTGCGLRAASTLRAGDYLLSHSPSGERHAASFVPDHEHYRPVVIEQIFHALGASTVHSTRKVAPDDFHGDAICMQGQVDIVRARRELLLDAETGTSEGECERVLVSASMREPQIASERPCHLDLGAILRSAPGTPSRGALALDELALRSESRPLQTFRFGSAANLDVSLTKEAHQSEAIYTTFIGELLETGAGSIALDKIDSIRKIDFRGHVYDLQSNKGWIVANSILSSNCRCVTVPIVE